ncbi:hypothetical protein RHMOL_Rhmol07G0318100 [Rhododendron molle]|uniref:Uncharacterized protein n=1 Tax=Rhododendron molle TaxID=49168 RepID=A0ACC0N6X0_RHOML|nr:hypothetical protein RHMOL_Rhmol07G0318100 [Rhododendron molle]
MFRAFRLIANMLRPRVFLSSLCVVIVLFSFLQLVAYLYAPDYAPNLMNMFRSRDETVADLFEETVEGVFVFGDSTVSAGDFAATPYPYGLDWKNGPGGRFSNRYTIADCFATKVGTHISQPFNTFGKDAKVDDAGINFGTGGCGLLDKTRPPSRYWQCSSASEQKSQMINLDLNKTRIEKAVFLVSMAGNDFIFSYLNKRQVVHKFFYLYLLSDAKEFAQELGVEMKGLLETLYTFGARKFVVNNVGPVGCIPNLRHSFKMMTCNVQLNEDVKMYNNHLKAVLRDFANMFVESKVVLADSYGVLSLILDDPAKYGFKNVSHACCGKWSKETNMFECNNSTEICGDRKAYLFFDGAHTTDQANKVFADNCLSGKVCSRVGKH